MTDLLWLFVGSSLIFGGIAYAWWAKLKPLFLREELFTIRNELWDVAFANNSVDDPAHVQARRHLNALIRISALFSLPALKAAAKATEGRQCTTARGKASNPVLQAAIDRAYAESADAVVHYVLYRSAFGLCAITEVVFKWFVKKSLIDAISTLRAIRKWIKSVGPDELSQMEAAARHAKMA